MSESIAERERNIAPIMQNSVLPNKDREDEKEERSEIENGDEKKKRKKKMRKKMRKAERKVVTTILRKREFNNKRKRMKRHIR